MKSEARLAIWEISGKRKEQARRKAKDQSSGTAFHLYDGASVPSFRPIGKSVKKNTPLGNAERWYRTPEREERRNGSKRGDIWNGKKNLQLEGYSGKTVFLRECQAIKAGTEILGRRKEKMKIGKNEVEKYERRRKLGIHQLKLRNEK